MEEHKLGACNPMSDRRDIIFDEEGAALSSLLGSLVLMTGIFVLNFMSRIIFSPLMPTIESDLGIGHGEAGSLFLFISLGYFAAITGSGFVSSQLTHRKTIIVSAVALGTALVAVSFSRTLLGMRIGLIIVGLAAGLYLPSGISTITSMVREGDWGKALEVVRVEICARVPRDSVPVAWPSICPDWQGG
jgi:NNP family nitrate/nitrite transporter-like MFS transporter